MLAGAMYGLSFLIVRRSDPTPQPEAPAQTVTMNGKLACLPHKGDGPHTLECAVGLRANNGTFYALSELPDPTVEVDKDVEVTGVLSDKTDSIYDVAGTIEVTTVNVQ